MDSGVHGLVGRRVVIVVTEVSGLALVFVTILLPAVVVSHVQAPGQVENLAT